VMVSLELRFVQERADDGQMMYRLDPPIDIFVTYEGKRSAGIPVSKYAVRHMVAAEIEAEYAARHAEAVEKSQGKKVPAFFGRSKRARVPQEGEEEADQEMIAHEDDTVNDDGPEAKALTRVALESTADIKKKGDEKVMDIAEKPPVDFFGRPLVLKKPKVVAKHIDESLGPPEKKCKIAYRFNEGASAAVRKPVKMETLL